MRNDGHITTLIVREGLAEVDASVTAIRNAVSYVRSRTKRQNAFEYRRMSRGS